MRLSGWGGQRKESRIRSCLEVQGRLNVVKEAVETTVSEAMAKQVNGVKSHRYAMQAAQGPDSSR